MEILRSVETSVSCDLDVSLRPDPLQILPPLLRCSYDGKMATCGDHRWSMRVLNWQPSSKRSRQRPRTRWSDSIVQFAGGSWQEIAADNLQWDALEGGYVHTTFILMLMFCRGPRAQPKCWGFFPAPWALSISKK